MENSKEVIKAAVEHYRSTKLEPILELAMIDVKDENKYEQRNIYLDAMNVAINRGITNPALTDQVRLDLTVQTIAIEQIFAEGLYEIIEKRKIVSGQTETNVAPVKDIPKASIN